MKKLGQVFAETMHEIGSSDRNMIVMVGDISHGILQPFAKENPDRYFNIGICEPAMVNLAAGFSKVGLNPVVHTIAPFLIERAYEQIKLDFGYQKLNLNLVSVGGSFDYSQLGCSHHCYSDVSLISHLKRGSVVIPGSPIEFEKIFKQIYQDDSINYFRLPEYPHGYEINEDEINFGECVKIKEGSDITIAVTGTQLKNAISVSEKLGEEGMSIEILYFHTIKPFDHQSLRQSVKKTKKLVSLEELSAHDGIFNQCLRSCIGIDGVKYKQMAIDDFIHGYGSYEDLCKKAGLSDNDLERNIRELI